MRPAGRLGSRRVGYKGDAAAQYQCYRNAIFVYRARLRNPAMRASKYHVDLTRASCVQVHVEVLSRETLELTLALGSSGTAGKLGSATRASDLHISGDDGGYNSSKACTISALAPRLDDNGGQATHAGRCHRAALSRPYGSYLCTRCMDSADHIHFFLGIVNESLAPAPCTALELPVIIW